MRLELDRLDLAPEARGLDCSVISFAHLSERAKEAVQVVGRAVFIEFDRRGYNAILVPAPGKEGVGSSAEVVSVVLVVTTP